jgi:hypothetical protein
MAILNQLLSEQDLAKLSFDEREFLVERIDHIIASELRSPTSEVHKTIAQHLDQSLKVLGKKNIHTVRGA